MRVLVTRPRRDAERTAERLAALGHEAVVAPVLRIEPTREPPPAGPFDAVILTSANAVAALASLGGDAQALPVFAIGARTAEAAAGAGFRHVTPAGGDAASLAAAVAQAVPSGARLLHAVGRDRKPEPHASLCAAGFSMASWVAYEALAAARLPEAAQHALRHTRLDAVLHYSQRSAAVLLALVEDAGLSETFLGLAHLCLSADVAGPLHRAGARLVRIAEHPHESAALALVGRWAQESALAGSRKTQSGW